MGKNAIQMSEKFIIYIYAMYRKIAKIVIRMRGFLSWGRTLDIYAWVNNSIIGSGNGLTPVRCQATTRSNADLSSIGLLGTNFSDVWIKIEEFSFKKIHLKMLSAKCWPFC